MGHDLQTGRAQPRQYSSAQSPALLPQQQPDPVQSLHEHSHDVNEADVTKPVHVVASTCVSASSVSAAARIATFVTASSASSNMHVALLTS